MKTLDKEGLTQSKKKRYITWDLRFRDREIESAFLEEKRSYQHRVSIYSNTFFVIFSIIMWAVGKDPLNLRQLIYNMVKIPMLISYIYLRKRYPLHIELIIILLMFPFFIIIIENTANGIGFKDKYLTSYMNGAYHETFCLLWLLLKISWKRSLMILLVINCFISFRYFDIQTNIDSNMSPFQICMANLLFHGLFAYILEKNERISFLKVKLKERSLDFFQNFIQETVHLGVIVIKRSEILYSNLESKRILAVEGRDVNIDDLNLLEIEEIDNNSEIFSEKESEFKSNILKKSLNNLLKNFSRAPRKNSNQFMGKTINNNLNQKTQKKFLVKVDKIIWNEEFATIITISEDLNAVRLEYLKEFELFKDRVLASFSHQFRTPLNAVMGILENLSETVTDHHIKDSLGIAMTSSQRLLSVINDILDFSQINLGKFSLNVSLFSANKLMKEIHQTFQPEALKKGISFLIESPSSAENDRISNDEGRLKQILCNFLSNSFRFTSTGFVKVSYELLQSNNSNRKIKFMIEDSGCGIKDSMITKLFEIFGKIREHDYKGLNTEGMGFGLAISHRLINAMNKNEQDLPIKVSSMIGKGSIFSFEINSISNLHPHKTYESHDLSKINEITEEDQPIENIATYTFVSGKNVRVDSSMGFIPKIKRKKRILIVDDDAVNLMVLSRYLKTNPDIDYVTAANGLEALKKIEIETLSDSNFDLVLMDCNMPVMDGYEATQKIRDLIFRNVIADLPVIAVTANVLPSDLAKCLDSGMADYLTKPLTKVQLFDKINKYLY